MVNRGEIWWVDLPPPEASEPGYRHPVLIISSNAFNCSAIQTLIGIVISSNTRLVQAPGNVYLPKSETGLPKDSIANISQVITIDKRFLRERTGVLPQALLEQIEDGIRLVLEL